MYVAWQAQIKNLIMKYLIFIAIVFSSCSPIIGEVKPPN
jgi:hypothetical protein